jgi:hypothetical protein
VSVIVGPGMDDAGHLGRCLAGIFYQDRSLRPPESPIVTISGKMRQYGAVLDAYAQQLITRRGTAPAMIRTAFRERSGSQSVRSTGNLLHFYYN